MYLGRKYNGPKCDFHTHILPSIWPDLKKKYGYGGWIQLETNDLDGKSFMMKDDKFFREVDVNCYEPEAIIKDMNNFGIDIQVICTVPSCFHIGQNWNIVLICQNF